MASTSHRTPAKAEVSGAGAPPGGRPPPSRGRGRFMRRFARWHIWLGWLAGVPLVLWTLSGLVMVAKPIEEVRGENLRREIAPAALPLASEIAVRLPTDRRVTAVGTRVEGGRVITRLTYADDTVERFDEAGRKLAPFSDVEARLLIAKAIVGGDRVRDVRLTSADEPPLDFRRPIAAWQVTLADGTRVYVARGSGEIAAVRTRWWRVFDFMWGLHIMDLQTREDTHHPILIGFATLALVSCLIGTALLFRRRRTRGPAQAEAPVEGAPDGLRPPPALERRFILSDAESGVGGRGSGDPGG
jgi:hypothetical protein